MQCIRSSATTSTVTDASTYDANGNRLTQTGANLSTSSVSSNSNRLTGVSGSLARTCSYTSAGMVSGDGTNTFTYNNRERMLSAANTGGTTSYLYSVLGQLIQKATSSPTNLYMYDEAGHLLGEYDGSGNLIQETVWLGDIPVATIRPNGSSVSVYNVHADHLNAPKKVSRASDNSLVWRIDQDPFGTASANQNPSGIGTFIYNVRFPGQLYQSETGLNQNVNRDYDPQTGRYVEADPIGLIGGVNTYAYGGDSPVDFIDPSGLVRYQDPDKPVPNKAWPICDGHGGITIQYPTDPKIKRCMKDCIQVHEAVHIRELRQLTPTVCKNMLRYIRPKFDTPEQNSASEVRAYKAELQCLIKKLQGLSDCDDCKALIQYEISTDVPAQIQYFSTH